MREAVSDVSVHEELAHAEPECTLRHNAGVRAPNPQVLGCLTFFYALEVVRVCPKNAGYPLPAKGAFDFDEKPNFVDLDANGVASS